MINSEDMFTLSMYGNFNKALMPNATVAITGDCGSHCEDYGYPPGTGITNDVDLCALSDIEQPSPGKKAVCPPKQGTALINTQAYAWNMFISVPVSI